MNSAKLEGDRWLAKPPRSYQTLTDFIRKPRQNRMGTYVPHLNDVFCGYQAHIAFWVGFKTPTDLWYPQGDLNPCLRIEGPAA